MNIIDGKSINSQIGEQLFKKIKEGNLNPTLGILCVGNDKASHIFVNVKRKFGEKYGFKVRLHELDEHVTKEAIIAKIVEMESQNDAVIVQLPLPEKFKSVTGEILEAINIKKDVDNLTGKNFFTSPIVLALQKVLEVSFPNYRTDKSSIQAAVVGLGKVVGQPIVDFLNQENIDYISVGKTDHEKIQKCNLVIAGVGQPNIIKEEDIKPGSVLVDYGCSYEDDQIFGDFEKSCYEQSRMYTPVPGGMGPIVVACLFENVLNSLV